MSKRILIFVLAPVLLLFLIPVLLRKHSVCLRANGKIVAVAKRPWVAPWKGNKFSVEAGGTNVFTLRGDFFNFPVFIYPFVDGQKFLCIYDDDTAILVFVIDGSHSRTNHTESWQWPPEDHTRRYIADRATNVVLVANGLVRMPNYVELQEVSSHIEKLSPSELKTESLPTADFGFWRSYFSKEFLLYQVHTNRQSAW